MDRKSIAAMIDHTCLRPDARRSDIETLCREAVDFGFYSVCVMPVYIEHCRKLLAGSSVKICTVVGFPHGGTLTIAKTFEARAAESSGTHEIDMVMNISAAKNGDWNEVEDDIAEVVSATSGEILTKVIIEACLLDRNEKIEACNRIISAGADFIKTSTGFAGGGATIEDVELIKEIAKDVIGIKAAGGIRDYKTAVRMIEAGATRIGSSFSVEIIKQAPAE